METSFSHFHAGRLTEAIADLGAELRKQPSSVKLRTFLFELLCFAGEFDRAEKQLDILVEQDARMQLGVTLYKSLLRAHRQREQFFETDVEIAEEDQLVSPVRINGKSYERCEDEDPRIASSFEIYLDGVYARIPYREVEQIEIEAPSNLRDLLWIPAKISWKTESPFAGKAPHAFLPALAPGSWYHKDDAVRLGRLSLMHQTESGELVPYGAKLLLCGNEEIPLLEVRELAFPAS